ncbi:MAG: hypothetical protein A2X56_05485 [Nitrospirae bacterium GWC2_57_13]|nr:MAG: hypothetical protein A2X56_05485 [Nitrospirae bacterium GWC2_57_13]
MNNVFVFGILALLLTLASAGDLRAGERPNIILITFDSLAAHSLSLYGFGKETAPNLTRFADECHVFSDAVAQAGSTSLSLASLFTSRYPVSDRLLQDKVAVRKNSLFLPAVLQKNGYRTYAIVRDEYAKSRYGFGQGFDQFDEDYLVSDARETFDTAVSLARNLGDEPFFLWIHNEEPHSPYLPPERLFREFYPDNGLPTVYSFMDPAVRKTYEIDEDQYEKFHRRLLAASGSAGAFLIYGRTLTLANEELKQVRARYWGSIKYADEQAGRFLRYLKAQPFYRNTIVIITADHGESLGAHGIIDHNDLYQDIIRVPLLVHLPGQDSRKMIDTPVELADIHPTITNILGVNAGHAVRGEDLFTPGKKKLTQFSEYPDKSVSIRRRVKLVCDEGNFSSYDLRRDPGELAGRDEPSGKGGPCNRPALSDDIFATAAETAIPSGVTKEGAGKRTSPFPESLRIDSKGLRALALTEVFEGTGKKAYHFTRGTELLKIEVTRSVSAPAAERIVGREIAQVKGIFSNSFSPYPEDLSHEIECPRRLRPEYYSTKIDGERRHYLLTYGNDRFGIGVCSDDLIAYRYLMGWIHCRDRQELYKIRHFIPHTENGRLLVDFFTALRCRK